MRLRTAIRQPERERVLFVAAKASEGIYSFFLLCYVSYYTARCNKIPPSREGGARAYE
jgi:hypothetical protein